MDFYRWESENAAHLARREVQHRAPFGAVHVRAFSAVDYEFGKIAAITKNMVGHWIIIQGSNGAENYTRCHPGIWV